MGSILGFLVALVPLIVLHELGHMLAAKWAGVWVHEFGIGMPPRLVKLFKWQETEFTLNALPLGGFARMEGEGLLTPAEGTPKGEEEVKKDPEAERHGLYAQPPGKRMLIFLSGPMMNFITGWVLAIVLFLTGVPVIDVMQVQISEVAPNSPAAAAGLQAEDVIVAMNGEPVEDIEEVTRITQAHQGEELTLTFSRDDEEHTVSLVPRLNPPQGEGAMGVIITGVPVKYHIEPTPVPRALLNGTLSFFSVVIQTLWAPIRIVQGLIPAEAARPVGIVNISRIAYDSLEQSVTTGTLIPILNLLIIVSTSLGIFNLLPLPALDGGRILLTLVEKVRGKAVDPRIQERIHQAALAFFILLFVVITVLDILYPISLPQQLP
ncbi:MAG: M50 family metallopeptidase [Anaerolineae bacterium]